MKSDNTLLRQLYLTGIIPVIKVDQARDAVPLCRALAKGGLPVAEITFRTKAAEDAIRLVHSELPEVLPGAGTVLSTDMADRAWAAGAKFIVTPGMNEKVVRHCLEKGYSVLPGCSCASDIALALDLGLSTVTFFPEQPQGGQGLISALAGPYAGVRFVPTGGINPQNIAAYLNHPKVVACGGSWMVPEAAVKAGDWAQIEELAKEAVRTMLGFEIRHIGINCEDADAAKDAAEKLSLLTGWPMQKDDAKKVYVGDTFEVMKSMNRGNYGHIALGCNNVERAMAVLEERGFRFDLETLQKENGRPWFVYLADTFAGFSVHLIRK